MTIKLETGYKTARERAEDEKKSALLWLFIASRGLLPDFTEFYRLHRSQSLQEIDSEFRTLQNG